MMLLLVVLALADVGIVVTAIEWCRRHRPWRTATVAAIGAPPALAGWALAMVDDPRLPVVLMAATTSAVLIWAMVYTVATTSSTDRRIGRRGVGR